MLTKSDLQSLLQCSRKLWIEKNMPELAAAHDSSSARRLNDGLMVGEYARQELGRDILWPQTLSNMGDTVKATLDALSSETRVPAVEVPMLAAGLYARCDALLPDDSGYALQETKASTFPLKHDKVTAANPEDHHLNDISIQAWVMRESGIPMTRAELNLLDSNFRYPGNGNYKGLFRQLDVTQAVEALIPQVPDWVAQAAATIEGEQPVVQTGKQCGTPNSCPLIDYCKKLDAPSPAHPVELLPDLAGKSLAKKLRAKGYGSLLDVPEEELVGKSSELYRRIQSAHRTGGLVVTAGSEEILRSLTYPRYYFDFEGIDLPVPIWIGVRPYEQIPFQWSCHIERQPGVFEHVEFLDISGDDPSLPCIKSLLSTIDPKDGGPIFVYYAAYEKGRIEELAKRHPEYSEELNRYINRLCDLLPIVKDHMYHPSMKGSFSIKKVLPVVAPELDYANLAGVQDGTAAQLAYLEAALGRDTSPERKEEIERNLLGYCKQDTWAMVEVAYFLSGHGKPKRPHGM